MIYIDAQMPTNCYNCWIRKNMGCSIADDSGWPIDRRADNCPIQTQEPRLVEITDFDNADNDGRLPVWVEYRRDGEWDEFWENQNDEWAIIDKDYALNCEGHRCWTSRPTDKQREATPWELVRMN